MIEQAAPGACDDPAYFAFAAEPADADQRLDKTISARSAQAGRPLSRVRARALIEEGMVRIEAQIETDPSRRLREGQSVIVRAPPPAPSHLAPEALPLAIVYEDEAIIIIDKPAGLVVHPSAGHSSGTLVNALLAHCGASLSGIGGEQRPGVVHRLDKDTSGLIVVAKNDRAHHKLAELFADHGRTLGLERDYLALVWGAPERASGVIDAPLGRHPTHREKQAVVRSGGRAARTHWRIEARYPHAGEAEAALVRCRLESGRTHQIRVHFAHIGRPVIGDPLYGAGFRTKIERLRAPAREALALLRRQALHAVALGFPHPLTGAPMRFESSPPADFAAAVQALEATYSAPARAQFPGG